MSNDSIENDYELFLKQARESAERARKDALIADIVVAAVFIAIPLLLVLLLLI